VLANIFAAVGVIAATITLLEVVLSEVQQKRIADYLLQSSTRLKEFREISLWQFIKGENGRAVLGFISLSTVSIYTVIKLFNSNDFLEYLGIHILIASASLLSSNIVVVYIIFGATTLVGGFFRCLFLSITSIGIYIYCNYLFIEWNDGFEDDWQFFIFVLITATIELITLLSVIILATITIVTVAWALSSVGSVLFKRLGDYPKGPIVAAGLVIAFLTGIYKALT
jgi:hypothetical protein